MNFQCEGSDDRISEFDLKLFQIENEHMEIPEQHYKVRAAKSLVLGSRAVPEASDVAHSTRSHESGSVDKA